MISYIGHPSYISHDFIYWAPQLHIPWFHILGTPATYPMILYIVMPGNRSHDFIYWASLAIESAISFIGYPWLYITWFNIMVIPDCRSMVSNIVMPSYWAWYFIYWACPHVDLMISNISRDWLYIPEIQILGLSNYIHHSFKYLACLTINHMTSNIRHALTYDRSHYTENGQSWMKFLLCCVNVVG